MGKDSIKVWSQRLTEDVIKQLEEVKENFGYETWSLMFELMIERCFNPLKVNEENERKIQELLKENLILTNQANENLKFIEKLENEIREEREKPIIDERPIQEALLKIEKLESENNENISIIEDQRDKLRNSVYIGSFNMKVLEKVAERETEKRGKVWNKSQIVNCIIDFRFVKGKLNAGFDSLPDSVINEIKEEV